MKQSIIIKEVNAIEVERISKNSIKEALNKIKELKLKLSPIEKKQTKFRIIPKIKT